MNFYLYTWVDACTCPSKLIMLLKVYSHVTLFPNSANLGYLRLIN